MLLDVHTISFTYGQRPVLQQVSFGADRGELIALLGPNGVGKSTLFRCLLGFLKPREGEIHLEGKPLAAYSSKELAQLMAFIPQSYSPAFDHTVLDTVLMGTAGQMGLFQEPGEEQIRRAMDMLRLLNIEELANQGTLRISGGERQLVLLARALVQNARMVLMDEPTANLDYGNSYRVMEQIEQLRAKGYTVLFSTHDPNQAYRYATRVLAMKEGRVLADGTPQEVLTPEVLSCLYGVSVHVASVTVDGETYRACVPYGAVQGEPYETK